jgi:hypothetical protein
MNNKLGFNENKPLVLKILIGLVVFKILGYLMFIIAFAFLRNIDPTELNVYTGIRIGIIESFDLNSSDMDYELGRLIGKLSVPIVLHIGLLFAIYKRWFKAVIGTMALIILVEFSIYSLICLILILVKRSRQYLKRVPIEKIRNASVLDDDFI